MSESAEVEVKLDDGGSSIKLPINVMVLFFHLHISHSTDRCNLSSCNVTICSPRCNHRSTAPCRISAMEFCPKDTHNSHASPIFCSLTQRTDVGVTGSSVFDYDAETDCRFTFDLRSDLNSEDSEMDKTFSNKKKNDNKKDKYQYTEPQIEQFFSALTKNMVFDIGCRVVDKNHKNKCWCPCW